MPIFARPMLLQVIFPYLDAINVTAHLQLVHSRYLPRLQTHQKSLLRQDWDIHRLLSAKLFYLVAQFLDATN